MDVEQLFQIIKERYSSSAPEGFDLMLWGDLHTLFEPDEDDEIWKDQHEYNLLSWRLHDFCGVHILLMSNGLAIHMLTEKKYPLSQEMLSKMLSTRLEVDHESSQAFELLRDHMLSELRIKLQLIRDKLVRSISPSRFGLSSIKLRPLDSLPVQLTMGGVGIANVDKVGSVRVSDWSLLEARGIV
ncbi:hypothetical protein Tco_1002636 [Tanacetum coccineum]|uniref:Uncharacterized protein n=1 Tax=Tanacetum coccineum TaxID=301880 RepID=A0ABQ5F8A1_9ASTR